MTKYYPTVKSQKRQHDNDGRMKWTRHYLDLGDRDYIASKTAEIARKIRRQNKIDIRKLHNYK
jgi:hypothetical protein